MTTSLIKWGFIAFFIIFGILFLTSAMVIQGNKIGKFSKTFCLFFGAVMTGAGVYLSY